MRTGAKFVLILIGFIVSLAAAGNASAATLLYESITRTNGASNTETFQFASPDSSGLIVVNADNQITGTVTLNGVELVSENDFSGAAPCVAVRVDLLADNELVVVVKGKPGGMMEVEVFDAAGSAGCGGSVGILGFAAAPPAIVEGTSSTLSWNTVNATSCSIDQGIGAAAIPAGSAAVSPAVTTTYTLTCQGPNGPATAQTTVSVVPALAILSFTATDPQILAGGSSLLEWDTLNATACSIDQGLGAVVPPDAGASTVSPAATTTYTLTCSAPLGQSATASVMVEVVPLLEILSFTADPGTINIGESSLLEWDVAGPAGTNCDLDQGIGAVVPPASLMDAVSVSPVATTTYTLTCNALLGQTDSASVVVEVNAEVSLQWRLRNNSGPLARSLHAMAYDSIRDRVVLYGGSAPGGHFSDTWEYNGSSWSQISASGPVRRAAHSMTFDESRGVVVLFGGIEFVPSGPNVGHGDTWEYDGISWTQVTTTGPAPRDRPSLVYDSLNQRVLMFGGATYQTSQYNVFNDLWEWDGATWSQIITPTSPPPLLGASFVYDSNRNVAVVTGGSGTSGINLQTWEFDGTDWMLVATGAPAPRRDAAEAYFPEISRVVVTHGFGINRLTNVFQDTWGWNGLAWEDVTPGIPRPTRREGADMVYDSTRHRLVFFGGFTASFNATYSDTWTLELAP